MTGKHRAPDPAGDRRAALLARLRALVPASARGRIHALVPALATFLITTGVASEPQVGAWAALALVIADHALSTLHAETPARRALYPILAAAATVGVAHGIVTESQTDALLGLSAAILGSAGAAWLTPRAS